MKTARILLAVICTALFSEASPPVPIAYSNEVRTIRYERTTGYLYAPGSTNLIVGYKTESTNHPAAIIHAVTYGRETNALFRLWTVEKLDPPSEEWRNAEWRWYEDETWVSRP
mgnify:CR=1 FL=1